MKKSPDPYNPTHPPLLIVISGPSGVGKDSVVQQIQERDYPFHFVVTATTRAPRPQEEHGKDYFFISETEFEKMIEEDELLEHALVYGQHKGIPKQQVREALTSGKDVVMRLDVQGAATVKTIVPEAILVFLTAASEEELLQRLHKRATDSEEQIRRRFQIAREELKRIEEFDYLVVNPDSHLHQAVDTILSIIEAEHSRVHPRRVDL
ncbi:MAG: guanylate kinase [Anaerolineales bacterium]